MPHKCTIKPETRNILGSSQKSSAPKSENQSSLRDSQTLWQRVKSGAKKAFGLIRQAVDYVKDKIVPIAIAAASLLNAWSNFHRCAGNGRRVSWSA